MDSLIPEIGEEIIPKNLCRIPKCTKKIYFQDYHSTTNHN